MTGLGICLAEKREGKSSNISTEFPALLTKNFMVFFLTFHMNTRTDLGTLPNTKLLINCSIFDILPLLLLKHRL
jgi:hypothetical protein